MVEMSYVVEVTREGDAWIADVVDLPGAHTYARNLTALDDAVQEVIALVADLPEGSDRIPVSYRYAGVDEPFLQAAHIGEEREQVEVRQRELFMASAIAAAKLSKAGYSVRDISGALKMSPGRVSQIINEETATGGVLPTWLVAEEGTGYVHSWHFSEDEARAAQAGHSSRYFREIRHTATGWETAPNAMLTRET